MIYVIVVSTGLGVTETAKCLDISHTPVSRGDVKKTNQTNNKITHPISGTSLGRKLCRWVIEEKWPDGFGLTKTLTKTVYNRNNHKSISARATCHALRWINYRSQTLHCPVSLSMWPLWPQIPVVYAFWDALLLTMFVKRGSINEFFPNSDVWCEH